MIPSVLRRTTLGLLAILSGVATAGGQTIIRPTAPAPAARAASSTTATGPSVRTITVTPGGGAVAGPDAPNYRVSGYLYGTNTGMLTAGAGAYAGYNGFPGYGYSSRYGAPAYGYGAYKAYYGFPGYNQVAPAYAYRGYQGAYYGPGFTPNAGYGVGYTSRGYGAYAPLGGR